MGTDRCRNSHPSNPSSSCRERGNHELCRFLDADDLDAEFEDVPNPNWVAPMTVPAKDAQSHVRALAARIRPVAPPAPSSGFQAGLEGSERAAGSWTEADKAAVDAAIVAVAEAHRRGGEFTTDAIWDQLAGSVPVTKGLTARLAMAQRRGIILNTEKTTRSERGGHHDHGQRLALWCSLL